MIWNPAPHMQHAWTDAKSGWAKIALILFYSLVWFNIIMAVWTMVQPSSFGGQCWIDLANPTHDETVNSMFVAGYRTTNVFVVGFFAYADAGGLTVKNVAMVTIVMAAFSLMQLPTTSTLQGGACSGMLEQIWFFPVWAIAALVFTLLDEKLGDRGTTAENESLVG
jgi:hypothetical protein